VLAPGAERALASSEELLVASLWRFVAAGAPAADDSLADPALPDSEGADPAAASEDALAAVALASELPAAD